MGVFFITSHGRWLGIAKSNLMAYIEILETARIVKHEAVSQIKNFVSYSLYIEANYKKRSVKTL